MRSAGVLRTKLKLGPSELIGTLLGVRIACIGGKNAAEVSIALRKGAAASLSETRRLEDPSGLAASQPDQLTTRAQTPAEHLSVRSRKSIVWCVDEATKCLCFRPCLLNCIPRAGRPRASAAVDRSAPHRCSVRIVAA